MARFVKGDVVVVPFPFSDITQSKRRPAVVIASLDGDDVILCQITSKMIKDKYALALEDTEFEAGGLKQSSSIRPNRIFTADSHIILYRIGKLRVEKISEIIDRVIEIVKA
jgi:mRNA interferase MazF